MAKTQANTFVDEAGAKVVHFMGDVRTLGKLGELSSKIIEMAESGAWRRYRTAVGVDEWLECEFDYFLIGCELEHDDVYKAIKWHKLGETTRAMMDRDAGPDKRRSLEEAAAAYHAAGPETLIQKAERLHWIGPSGKLRSPLSPRQRAKQASGGKTLEEQARVRRAQRITVRRRRELDRLARETFAELSEDERRYLVDAMAKQLARTAGRPTGDHEQWAKDIADLAGDAKALAERWGISKQATHQRLGQLNSRIKLMEGS